MVHPPNKGHDSSRELLEILYPKWWVFNIISKELKEIDGLLDLTLTIHLWYIYLHLPYFTIKSQPNGKYTIHIVMVFWKVKDSVSIFVFETLGRVPSWYHVDDG